MQQCDSYISIEETDILDIKCPPKGSGIEGSVSSWQHYFGRFWKL
jgi:hypothetical protein